MTMNTWAVVSFIFAVLAALYAAAAPASSELSIDIAWWIAGIATVGSIIFLVLRQKHPVVK